MFYIYCSVKSTFLKSPLNKTEENLFCMNVYFTEVYFYGEKKKKKLHTSLLHMFHNDKKAKPAKDALEKII